MGQLANYRVSLVVAALSVHSAVKQVSAKNGAVGDAGLMSSRGSPKRQWAKWQPSSRIHIGHWS